MIDKDLKRDDSDRGRDRSRSRSRERRHDRSRDRRDRSRDKDRTSEVDGSELKLYDADTVPAGRKSDHYDSRRDDRRRKSRSRSRRRSSSPIRKTRRRSYTRSRSGSRSRSRSRSRERGGHRGGGRREKPAERIPRSLGGPMNAPQEEATEFAKVSKRENRVYVGNLAYDVKYGDLIEFMKPVGEVAFAEILTTPNGVSKGCGLVEFANREDAQRAIRELTEQALIGRPVFIREDREAESRFGVTPVPGKMGAAIAGLAGGYPSRPLPRADSNPGNQLYVGNLPYQAGWQDLKDLFRSAGSVVRADINIGPDGRAKGSGTVVFESAKDAQSAIQMFNGYDWYGRQLEVREDRYAGLSGPSFRGGRGGLRGGFIGGYGGRGSFRGGFRGSFRGGYGGSPAAAAAVAASAAGNGGGNEGGRGFSSDIYADYIPPDQQMSNGGGPGGYSSGPAYGGAPSHGYGGGGRRMHFNAEPSQQIMVRNLPWSTANEDLVELFETTGNVELAEILFDGTRSKGAGVVQFTQTEEAETAIAKFQGYMYGGRPLDVAFNDRWHTFTPTAAKGGSVAPMM
ncbi:hypothetical protein M407DRAFT_217544 [Tulasnella calospora MUT 4182]|uniref:RRM domain-containing protein n=1 Tax=Tulasnella calospora MUT 4182 TaxID=1051891 RepID=A0A0C3KK63_9AGAM|nr:hypothetical protein M407DRAFT_217544 [Tulasnella calospora MUT 4182]